MARPIDGLKKQRPGYSRTPLPQKPQQPSVWQRGARPMSDFDPTAGPTGWYFPQARLQQLESQYQSNPGRRPGGSGLTGLTSGDAHGWSQMLNEQQEFMNLLGHVTKKGRPGVQTAPLQERHMTSGIAPATGEANDPFGLGGSAEPNLSAPLRRKPNPGTTAAVNGLKGIR